ncbi:putative actin [Coleophoma cylindrospora]|uniref:Putative actin n=1 Tax=Coleophoma cylindrospora TaxID=1849047 RepID=A0A3D8S8I2_9HELO|nr:putative actin [Coleophoma cylindrospora]
MASQTMNSSMQPTDVYGGDEVSAIVLDPGYTSVRAGFAGEEVPKSFVSAHYGQIGDQLIFGDNEIHNYKPGMEIRNPMGKDGVVEDWDVATKLFEYSITSRLTRFPQSDPRSNGLNDDPKDADVEMDAVEEQEKTLEEHPLLMTETAWSTTKSREKSIEIAMENWGCPAFWLARNSVLAAFASGKATALVVDVGASNVSVISIHDGLILKKSIQKSPLAGNWLSSQLRSLFGSVEPKVDLVPHFMVRSKTPVDAGAPAQAIYREFKIPPTASFRALEEDRVLTEFKESVIQVWPGPGRLSSGTGPGSTNEDVARSQPGRVFEMPDGANQMWGLERFKVAEGMWDEKAALPVAGEIPPTKAQTIPEMIKASLGGVDMDLRPTLLQNVVVTGGTSLISGFNDRLNAELTALYPGARIKIQAAGLTSERRFGSWIGGSILGSLGTFHQMWISKKEYDEFGANVVEKRCK